ncbi:MAG: hemerythrin domain-containing protein [Proteobacteria bacterium]|nr:hemerythrin domain-containing protein [Pseudomonadota bacterium]
MTAIIDQLEHDHRNLAGLLQILETELDTLERIEAPDYPLMNMVLDYLLTYPDLVHHPKEDLIYRSLLKRRPELRDRLDDLEVEHQVLSSMTLEFADGLRRVVNGVTVGRSWLIETGRTFVDTYRRHMKSENAGVFLLAREHLTAEDLELAAADFHPIADPLFGGATEARFARLLTSIEIAAGLS